MGHKGRLCQGLSALVVSLLLEGCGGDPPGRVDGAAQSLAGSYAVGQNVRVVSPNGAVTARRGSAAGEIFALFRPFVTDAEDDEQAAAAMSASLAFSVDDGGNTIVISVSVAPGAPGGLGADIDVSLPTSFAGGFEVEQWAGPIDADLGSLGPTYITVQSTRGAVTVRGARGQLELTVLDGPCSLQADEWSTSNGSVDLATGNLDFLVRAGISGRIDAEAGTTAAGSVVAPSPMPTDWSEEVVAANHRRFAFGPDAAGLGMLSATAAAPGSVITVGVLP